MKLRAGWLIALVLMVGCELETGEEASVCPSFVRLDESTAYLQPKAVKAIVFVAEEGELPEFEHTWLRAGGRPIIVEEHRLSLTVMETFDVGKSTGVKLLLRFPPDETASVKIGFDGCQGGGKLVVPVTENPLSGEGEPCDGSGFGPVCAEGLVCFDAFSEAREDESGTACELPEPPQIVAADLVLNEGRFGLDVVVSDVNRDLTTFVYQVLDAEGGVRLEEVSELEISGDVFEGQAIFEQGEGAAQVVVQATDSQGLTSEALSLEARMPEVVELSGACDFRGVFDRCVEGTVCGLVDGEDVAVCLEPDTSCPQGCEIVDLNEAGALEGTDLHVRLSAGLNSGRKTCTDEFEDVYRFTAPESGPYRIEIETLDGRRNKLPDAEGPQFTPTLCLRTFCAFGTRDAPVACTKQDLYLTVDEMSVELEEGEELLLTVSDQSGLITRYDLRVSFEPRTGQE